MARAAPPITLVALIVACLVLAMLAAPTAGAAATERPRAQQVGLAPSTAAQPAQTAAQPSRTAARKRNGKRIRRCSAAGIRRVRGTSRIERRIRCLLNRRRAGAGLRALRYDRCLDRAAERHARDMVRRRYFAHTSRSGRNLAQRVRASGYVSRAGSWRLGENLAWGNGRRASAHSAVRGWMLSPPHRANILTAGFRDVGVAVVHGAPVKRARSRPATFVVEFGARQPGRCRR
jgi:uncharacterized protein YkwD